MNNLQRFINSAPSVLHLGYHSKNLNSIQTFTNPTNHTWDQTKLTLSYRSSDQLSLFCSFQDMQFPVDRAALSATLLATRAPPQQSALGGALQRCWGHHSCVTRAFAQTQIKGAILV